MRKFLKWLVSALSMVDLVCCTPSCPRYICAGTVVEGRIPCRGAVLAGLAEQEPQLLEALVKRIFGGHIALESSLVGAQWMSTCKQPAHREVDD